MFSENEALYFANLDFDKAVACRFVEDGLPGIESTFISIEGKGSMFVRTDFLARSEEEARQILEREKEAFRRRMLEDGNWIKELFQAWAEGSWESRALVQIMKEIAEEKTGATIG